MSQFFLNNWKWIYDSFETVKTCQIVKWEGKVYFSTFPPSFKRKLYGKTSLFLSGENNMSKQSKPQHFFLNSEIELMHCLFYNMCNYLAFSC